ncbi:sigma 54-interacting transcriptional regulator [Tissierella sp. MSJ-40]|uniref:Sigma 54-interacting transcriptional regulator n=1 Tax=Tissierella simiarum TaxID=2841534 RepID=A0ABS6E8J4_9FIRM|nr:sigma 54-interacting transcriptional regulator [Tissierella simiarum]MBU5439250.1 sigma 54-interacting transcriptional regulator [Tissierella simiarum]
MIELKYLKPTLNNIVATLSNITNLEFAIFDTKSKLVSSTQVYLQRKGKNVHSASIEEVLLQGNVVVNKPGHMASCIGCRFVNNCPSTIEILSCIKLNNYPIGVVSLTSFSQEGHMLIEDNIRNYMEILEYTSNLISMFAYNETYKKDTLMLHKTIDEIIQDTENNLLVIDGNGVLTHWGQGIKDLFSYCDLYTQTIYQMFPEEVTNWLFNSKKNSKKYLATDNFKGTICSTPIKIDNEILGYIIKLTKDNKGYKNDLEEDYLKNIIGSNRKMDKIKDKIKKVSNSSSSVLITGETGTGKEIIAKAIHFLSNRKKNPFVPINCANIPESLFESELFGYEEGAFTGAKKGGKPGLFEMANGGTIFLDEIGELPLYLQAKLLRVLQENTIQRLGSINPIPIDIRIIAATNQDLESMMEEDNFRDDLYYRLNVIPIDLPPLRERLDDIDILVYHFIKKYSNKLDKKIDSISNEALDILKNYSWPGNIRELENSIEYAINMEETSSIQPFNLPKRIRHNSNFGINIKDRVAEKEADIIICTLDKYGWDLKGKEQAAETLGISLRTLYRRLRELGIN